MTPWKRGLLKAWLALSLFWAAVAASYLIRFLWDFLDSWVLVALFVIGLLPFAALPPMALLGLGCLVLWMLERRRAP